MAQNPAASIAAPEAVIFAQPLWIALNIAAHIKAPRVRLDNDIEGILQISGHAVQLHRRHRAPLGEPSDQGDGGDPQRSE